MVVFDLDPRLGVSSAEKLDVAADKRLRVDVENVLVVDGDRTVGPLRNVIYLANDLPISEVELDDVVPAVARRVVDADVQVTSPVECKRVGNEVRTMDRNFSSELVAVRRKDQDSRDGGTALDHRKRAATERVRRRRRARGL